MTKRKTQPKRRDWRLVLFLFLSLLIVLTMALALVVPALNPPG